MNDASTIASSAVILVMLFVSGLLAIYWLVFPLIVIWKFNCLLKEGRETNGHLALISHQITSATRGDAPPIAPEPQAEESSNQSGNDWGAQQ